MSETFGGTAVATETEKQRPGGYMQTTILRIEADVEAEAAILGGDEGVLHVRRHARQRHHHPLLQEELADELAVRGVDAGRARRAVGEDRVEVLGEVAGELLPDAVGEAGAEEDPEQRHQPEIPKDREGLERPRETDGIA
jgi:hypothetical protein